MMINLADEIIHIFNRYGYTREDIDWVGCEDFTVDTDWFFALADDTMYDNGYGSPVVPTALLIVMKDGSWFDRREYDGSEWFELHRAPSKPAIEKDFVYGRLTPEPYNVWDADDHLSWYVAN